MLSGNEVKTLRDYADRLDEKYWDLRNRYEQNAEGSREHWRAAFHHFLAVNCVALLAHDSSPAGIDDAIYEALATSDCASNRQKIMAALHR